MAGSTIACPPDGRRLRGVLKGVVFGVAATLAVAVASCPAEAQTEFLNFKTQVRPTPKKPSKGLMDPKNGSSPMLVQANEINYDYTNERVAAIGGVQIYYGGATIEADKVVYDQKTKRLRAEGNARLTEPDGKVTYGELIDLTDDYRDGFIDSLRLESPDQTRMAAARADRSSGTHTVFQSGVYTACEPCKDDPKKPPLWQVKAARIIHNQQEKMMYFEDAKIEFFGYPLAYFPYLATPDPTVKRKSGVLMPLASYSSLYGAGIEIPYYFALAPNYDLTLSPKVMSRQGVLMQGEFQHRLESGAYTVRAAGIYQLDKTAFPAGTAAAQNDFRGSVESQGKFALSPNWVWGWDAVVLTDPTFFYDYKVRQLQALSTTIDPFARGLTEGISQLYLVGRGERSYFDARTVYYKGFSAADNQGAIPVVHPVIDYSNVLDHPVFGGELSYKINLTSLSRNSVSYDAISQTAVTNSLCSTATADPAVKIPANCLLRGVPGTYTRFTAETSWRRQVIDSLGQVWTPFVSLRADAAAVSIKADTGVSNYLQTGDSDVFRGMPTVGLEYRYPFIGIQSWGTQTVEPIAQLILRPSESNIGKLPNEDSQSLVFDDTNLFKVDKFSGYDRVEGGSRANVGVQYTAQFNRGGFFNVLFGQSHQLFGTNSFAAGDVTNTGLGSGLDKAASDYVARVAYQPNRIYSLVSRFRFDEGDLTLRRLEVEGRANFDRWILSMMYGNYDAQPQLGFLTRREGILGTAAVKLNANWSLSGAARYDIHAGKISQTRVGIGYIDDCYIFGLSYITDFAYSATVQTNQSVMLQMGLRTLGGSSGL